MNVIMKILIMNVVRPIVSYRLASLYSHIFQMPPMIPKKKSGFPAVVNGIVQELVFENNDEEFSVSIMDIKHRITTLKSKMVFA